MEVGTASARARLFGITVTVVARVIGPGRIKLYRWRVKLSS